MISSLEIVQYRKLKDIRLPFVTGVNVISGTNGTCKSSVLHLISNAYKRVKQSGNECLSVIAHVNAGMNCKIEALVKGDKKYRDPARGIAGNLFSIKYENGVGLGFRRHNAPQEGRFSVKPQYARGAHEKLPEMPVFYLGLPRLLPCGELSDDVERKRVGKRLPSPYGEYLIELYKSLSGIEISAKHCVTNIASLKCREEFNTSIDGVDSNTISSGEDNLLCIVRALVSLRYYYETLPTKTGLSESVLLIDELDAALHPSMQEELCDVLRQYSTAYKIQIVCTTHSLTVLENSLRHKDNVLYFIDDVNHVSLMDAPDLFKIRMHLKNCTRKDLYAGRQIPVFTEDDEARAALTVLLDHVFNSGSPISHLRTHFHLIESKLGADHIKTIFADKCLSLVLTSFAILDGDKHSDISANQLVLPGGASPERFLYAYGLELYKGSDDGFWRLPSSMENGYSRKFFERISREWESMESEIVQLKQKGLSSEGVRRRRTKEIWGRYEPFFVALMSYWVKDLSHKDEVVKFTDGLKVLFHKTAAANGLNPNDWA